MEEKNIIEIALKYKHSLGLNVLPVKVMWNDNKKKYDKKPLVPWRELETREVTDEEIKKWWTQYPDAGIGAVVGNISKGVVVIDCDSAAAIEAFDQLIPDSLIIPCSKSISGARHYFFSADKACPKKTRFYRDMDFQGENSLITLPPTRGKNGDHYSWICEPITKKDFPSLAEVFLNNSNSSNSNIINNNLYRELVSLYTQPDNVSNLQVPTNLTSANSGNIFEAGKRDDNLYHIAHGLYRAGNQEDYIKQVLRAIVWSWGERDERWISDKVKSVMQRSDVKSRNVQNEIKEYILIQKSLTEPYVVLTECLQSLQLLTREAKNAAYSAFTRLCQEGNLIVKQQDKRGIYRILYNEKDVAKMDLTTESEVNEIDVKMPLDLNRLCVISPGNICVVAGSKSSGKTAMLMNIALFNQHNFDVIYLNSEMSETEFKKRMKRFAPLSDWKITGYKCHNNFDDYITGEPGKIYIVDYLEVHKDFYDIATPIRKIHEKLGDSVCFIGIQMKTGGVLGRGGEFSAEKARLYITMDYQEDELQTKVTIYDAKEPRPPHDNVRGLWRMVKIINGASLSINPQRGWGRGDKEDSYGTREDNGIKQRHGS